MFRGKADYSVVEPAKLTLSPLSLHAYKMSLSLQVRGKADNLLLYGMIGGGKKPKSIQAYLRVLVGELARLWTGVEMYDAFKKEVFTLQVMLAANMHDYPEMRAVALQADAGEKRAIVRPSKPLCKAFKA